MSLKVLHSADFHAREKDIDECRKVLTSLVNDAEKIKPDVIVLSGDLTDRNDVKLDSQTARLVIWTVTRLSHAAPVAIVTGTKFHDGNIPELMQSVQSHFPVYVSTYPEQVVLTKDNRFEAPGVGDGKILLSLIPTPTKQFFDAQGGIEETDRAIGEAMSTIFAGYGVMAEYLNLPHVLAGHWQVGGAYVSETQQLIGRDIEVSVDQILSARASVTCLGHIHYGQQIGRHPIFYSGSTYRKDYGEMEDKGFYVHSIADTGIAYETSEWIELPTRKLVKGTRDFATDEGLEGNPDLLAGGYLPEDVSGSHVRVELRVWQDQRDQIDRAGIKQTLLDMGAAEADIQIVSVPRQNVRAEEVLKAERLRDKIVARAEIVGESVSESILAKCDAIEAESREEIIERVKDTEKIRQAA